MVLIQLVLPSALVLGGTIAFSEVNERCAIAVLSMLPGREADSPKAAPRQFCSALGCPAMARK